MHTGLSALCCVSDLKQAAHVSGHLPTPPAAPCTAGARPKVQGDFLCRQTGPADVAPATPTQQVTSTGSGQPPTWHRGMAPSQRAPVWMSPETRTLSILMRANPLPASLKGKGHLTRTGPEHLWLPQVPHRTSLTPLHKRIWVILATRYHCPQPATLLRTSTRLKGSSVSVKLNPLTEVWWD